MEDNRTARDLGLCWWQVAARRSAYKRTWQTQRIKRWTSSWPGVE